MPLRVLCTVPVIQNAVFVRQRPFDQSLDVRHQAAAAFGQAVFYLGRYLSINFSLEHTVRFQRAEGDRQHALRDIADRPLDVAEAHDTVRMQGDQHERRPFVAQSAQHVSDRTDSVAVKILHFFRSPNDLTTSNRYSRVIGLFRGAFLYLYRRKPTFAIYKYNRLTNKNYRFI